MAYSQINQAALQSGVNPADRNNMAIQAGYTLITLTKGKTAIIDSEDANVLGKYRWHASLIRDRFYAKTGHQYLHRIVMGAKKGQQIDHINGDCLDNRKSNLRICNNIQNNQNKGPQKNNKLGLKGVILDDRHKYHVTIQIPNGKYKFIGRFNSPKEAGLAYDEAAKKYFGEFAYLNFK